MIRKLHQTRSDIDRIDRELIALLARRMEAVRSIGALKREHAETPLRDDAREREIFSRWAELAQENRLSAYFVQRILREILNYSRRDQDRMLERSEESDESAGVRIGYQGVQMSYSDLAITKLFDSRDDRAAARTGYGSFVAVLDALEAHAIDYALLPIENTIAGSINEVYQLLGQRDVHIVDEEVWTVEHCLAGAPGSRLEDIRCIRSHPVALQQCQQFLASRPGIVSVSVEDTAAAARGISESGELDAAAICSEEAAAHFGLEVLRRGIADQASNLTRFVLVSMDEQRVDARQPAKISLLLTLNHRRGALASCLAALAERDVNLTKLESRPVPHSPWEYLFYVDLEGHLADPHVEEALDELRRYTNHLKILGCYPRRSDTVEASHARAADERATPQGPSVTTVEAESDEGAGRPERSYPPRRIVDVGGVHVGGDRFVVIAGPSAVESRDQILESARIVREAGGAILRAAAFRSHSSPETFQGLGPKGLELLAEAGEAFELPVLTEVMRPEDVALVAARADLIQVGARNMQNFSLLKRLGSCRRPILLQRGAGSTIDELLLAAEYIVEGGNQQVILCERGIRTFETATRATLDLSAVPVLRRRSELPVVVDPSFAAGDRDLVMPLALATAAAGADGLVVEVHPEPDRALCDGDQALWPETLGLLLERLTSVVEAGVREH